MTADRQDIVEQRLLALHAWLSGHLKGEHASLKRGETADSVEEALLELRRLRAENESLANLRVERHEYEAMQRDKEEALAHYSRVRAENDALREALREVRKAASSGREFTNRMQYIHARAGHALDGLPWDDDRKREYGYTIRDHTMADNDALRLEVAAKDAEIADWYALEKQTAAALLAANEEIERLKREHLARSKIDPTTRLHNLCDHLAEHRRESPYDEQSWHLQDEAYKEKCAALLAKTEECAALAKDAERLRSALENFVSAMDEYPNAWRGLEIHASIARAALALPPAQEQPK